MLLLGAAAESVGGSLAGIKTHDGVSGTVSSRNRDRYCHVSKRETGALAHFLSIKMCWRMPAGPIIQNHRLAAQECHPYLRVIVTMLKYLCMYACVSVVDYD